MFFVVDGVNVIQFGTGDVNVMPGLIPDEEGAIIGSLSLAPQEPKPIGTYTKFERPTLDTEMDVHTRLVFTNVESLDVLIKALEDVRWQMRAEETDFFIRASSIIHAHMRDSENNEAPAN